LECGPVNSRGSRGRGTEGNAGNVRGCPVVGSKLSVSEEARQATFERRISGSQVPVGRLSSKKREVKGMQNCHVAEGGSVDDGVVGVVSPGVLTSLMLGADGAIERTKSNSPPRRRKKKGLTELGDSCSYPKRSVRLSVRLPQARSIAHHIDGMSLASISDMDIYNYNSRLSESVNVVEPSRLWELGKQVGLKCLGDEEQVVKEYVRMEDWDSEFVLRTKMGGKNVS